MNLNYEALLELAREEALRKSRLMWPNADDQERERRRLVVRYYLERISPIVVDEANTLI
jgi:hypothetical protein